MSLDPCDRATYADDVREACRSFREHYDRAVQSTAHDTTIERRNRGGWVSDRDDKQAREDKVTQGYVNDAMSTIRSLRRQALAGMTFADYDRHVSDTIAFYVELARTERNDDIAYRVELVLRTKARALLEGLDFTSSSSRGDVMSKTIAERSCPWCHVVILDPTATTCHACVDKNGEPSRLSRRPPKDKIVMRAKDGSCTTIHNDPRSNERRGVMRPHVDAAVKGAVKFVNQHGGPK